jgi:hypothetical protein
VSASIKSRKLRKEQEQDTRAGCCRQLPCILFLPTLEVLPCYIPQISRMIPRIL